MSTYTGVFETPVSLCPSHNLTTLFNTKLMTTASGLLDDIAICLLSLKSLSSLRWHTSPAPVDSLPQRPRSAIQKLLSVHGPHVPLCEDRLTVWWQSCIKQIMLTGNRMLYPLLNLNLTFSIDSNNFPKARPIAFWIKWNKIWSSNSTFAMLLSYLLMSITGTNGIITW